MRLTSIRGIASIIVLLHHAMLLFRVDGRDDTLSLPLQLSDPWLLLQQLLLILFNGQAAVTLFFVLSGCVLALSLQRSPVGLPSTIAGFYIKRAFRIMPTLWLAVLISFLLLPYNRGAHVDAISTRWMEIAYSRSPSLYEFARHLIGLDSFLDQPLWSLFVELFYSAAFPAIFLLTRGNARSVGMIVTSIIGLLLPFQVIRDLNYFLLAFVLGSAIANRAPETSLSPVTGTVFFGFACLLLLATRRVLEPIGGPAPIIIFFETCGAAAIIYLVLHMDKSFRWLNSSALVHLGNISFSLYLLHFPLLFVIARWFENVADVGFIRAHPIASNLMVGAITAACVVPIATLTFQLFELPTQQFGRALARKVYDLSNREIERSPPKES
jgi:peptidoglycan/LPS O-acetylase OafA/YrhL